MDIMRQVRKKAKTEEIDYLFLMECLGDYKKPRSKLTALLKAESLIRVKKGLYIFGKDYRLRPFSLEILANLIHGPSYVSYEYALSYFGLIPEKVTRITSASSKKMKQFQTPVGEFIYYYLNPKQFSVGITWESIDDNSHFLIATKEKALADCIARQRPFQSKEDLLVYLVEGMRIDDKDIEALKLPLMRDIASLYQNKNVTLLCDILFSAQS